MILYHRPLLKNQMSRVTHTDKRGFRVLPPQSVLCLYKLPVKAQAGWPGVAEWAALGSSVVARSSAHLPSFSMSWLLSQARPRALLFL